MSTPCCGGLYWTSFITTSPSFDGVADGEVIGARVRVGIGIVVSVGEGVRVGVRVGVGVNVGLGVGADVGSGVWVGVGVSGGAGVVVGTGAGPTKLKSSKYVVTEGVSAYTITIA